MIDMSFIIVLSLIVGAIGGAIDSVIIRATQKHEGRFNEPEDDISPGTESSPAARCKSGKHVWIWQHQSAGEMYNIWKCQKCGEIQQTSIL
jgi:hypothetical protein